LISICFGLEFVVNDTMWQACKRGGKETKQIEEDGLVDVDGEKSKLAEDLSKIRMVESLDASASKQSKKLHY